MYFVLEYDLAPTNRAQLTPSGEVTIGPVLWDTERTGMPASDIELVVRSIAQLGNYDYLVDWVFNQSGAIRVDALTQQLLDGQELSGRLHLGLGDLRVVANVRGRTIARDGAPAVRRGGCRRRWCGRAPIARCRRRGADRA